jgi:hypothetical protein
MIKATDKSEQDDIVAAENWQWGWSAPSNFAPCHAKRSIDR